MQDVAGQDATTAYEDVGHSHDAEEIMQGLLVGVLENYKPSAKDDTTVTRISPSEVVIRRHNKSHPAGDEQRAQTKHYIELAGLVLAASGLVYTVNKTHAIRRLDGLLREMNLTPHLGGFAQGFLTAGVALGGLGLFGAHYANRFLAPSESFTSFAPHIKSRATQNGFVPRGILDPSNYQEFKLRSKTEVGDSVYKFVFDLPSKHSILGLPIGQHVAIKAEIDDHTVVRSYTPISNNRDLGRLELMIRVYPDGQVGNYLKNLPVGQTAQIRGPKGAMKYRRLLCKHIGLIGGGTGITPLYQIIRHICEDPKDDTTISLIYGNRSESDIMLREKLEGFAEKYPQFKLHFTLDHPSESWTGSKGYVTKDLMQEKMPSPGPDTKIMICGPPGMVNAVKNGLVDLGYEAPGSVSKMQDQVFCF